MYRLAGVRPTWETDLIALVLHTDGVASHRSSAALWGLELYHAPRTLEVTSRTAAPVLYGAP